MTSKPLLYLLLLLSLILSTRKLVAQSFPDATDLAAEMKMGWNIGNTMEALYNDNGTIVGGETAWGNPKISQRLIDSVKAAGFNTVRIPIAWDVHATDDIIDPAWMARVKEVVDLCYNQDLYVIINIHWDNGWLEEHCVPSSQTENNRKQGRYWKQIATTFSDYDHHLLFASANEPNVDNATQMGVLLSYHQTFIDSVRATGSNNAERTLVIQGPRTDIEKTNSLMTTLPTDQAENKLMIEVHFYPYQFTLMEEDANWGNQFFYWGECNHSTSDMAHNPTWGEEDFVDEMFGLMKTKYVDQGYPVVLGEYGVRKRTNLTGNNYALHLRSREYYLKYVTKAAVKNGLIPYYWGAGLSDLFNRNTGAVLERGAVNALMAGAYSEEAPVNCAATDCAGTPFGNAYTNACGECVTGINTDCITSTNNAETRNVIRAYPNPTTGLIYFATEVKNWGVFNQVGQGVLRGTNASFVDLSELPDGFYFLHVDGNVQKVIKR